MLGPVLSQCSPPRHQPTSTLPPSLIHQTMARDTQILGATFDLLSYHPREVRYYQDEFCCNARRRRSACVKHSPSATLIKSCLATTGLLEVLLMPSSIFLANYGCVLLRTAALMVANGWLASNAHFQPHSWHATGRLSDSPSSLKVRNAAFNTPRFEQLVLAHIAKLPALVNLHRVVNVKDLHLFLPPFAALLNVLRFPATSCC
jgi:hypothetical protein